MKTQGRNDTGWLAFAGRQARNEVALTGPRSTALRQHLGIDADKDCAHEFDFGNSRFLQFSDNAVRRMEEAIATEDMAAVWQSYRQKSGFGGRKNDM